MGTLDSTRSEISQADDRRRCTYRANSSDEEYEARPGDGRHAKNHNATMSSEPRKSLSAGQKCLFAPASADEPPQRRSRAASGHSSCLARNPGCNSAPRGSLARLNRLPSAQPKSADQYGSTLVPICRRTRAFRPPGKIAPFIKNNHWLILIPPWLGVLNGIALVIPNWHGSNTSGGKRLAYSFAGLAAAR